MNRVIQNTSDVGATIPDKVVLPGTVELHVLQNEQDAPARLVQHNDGNEVGAVFAKSDKGPGSRRGIHHLARRVAHLEEQLESLQRLMKHLEKN